MHNSYEVVVELLPCASPWLFGGNATFFSMNTNHVLTRLDEESALRRDLENDLNDMRKDCDDATLVRLDLERRLETLQEEIEFLKRMHEQVPVAVNEFSFCVEN